MGIKKGLNLQISEIGKIKIGGKGAEITNKNKKKMRLPVKFDHFKVTTTERGEDGNFLPDEAVMTALSAEPKEIRIRFPFDNIDLNFYTSYQLYKGESKCKGDGEKATRTDKEGKVSEVTCNAEHGPTQCKYLKDGKCKPSGILSCYLPDSPSYGGVYRYRTHGWNSTGGILEALKKFSNYTGGILQGLPFKLMFIKKATEKHGNVSVVALVLDGIELTKMRELAVQEKEGRATLQINMVDLEETARESGFTEDMDDPADVEAEFYTDDDPADVEEPEQQPGTSADDVQDVIEAETETETDTPPADKDLF